MPAPSVTAAEQDAVVWRLADPEGELRGVRLWSDFDLGDTSFTRLNGRWELRLPREKLPAVDRLEYLFEVSKHGRTESLLDPDNPCRVGGAFGDHSVLSLAYQPPFWLDLPPVEGDRQPLVLQDTPVGDIHLEIWSPAGTDPAAELPLLLSHDGPEMDALGGLTRFVGAMIALRQAQATTTRAEPVEALRQAQGTDSEPAQGTEGKPAQGAVVGLPPMRVGLLAPGARDDRYAANPAYADTLCNLVVPAMLKAAPAQRRPFLMGQSLGALAALHAEWTHPGTFAGLLLQSGSFFTPKLDPQESGYSKWTAVTSFVAQVLAARQAPSTLPIAICFGTAEDNAANNRLMAAKLAALGCPVTVGEVRDGHNYTCWRDLLDPHLINLLNQRVVSGA